jgi:protein SCO1/2
VFPGLWWGMIIDNDLRQDRFRFGVPVRNRRFLFGVHALACQCGTALLTFCAPLSSGTAAPATAQPPETQSFSVKGSVREVRRGAQTLLVSHEAIAGYMEAMTMPFRVKEPIALDALQGGDQITFQLHVTDEQSWIDHISKIGFSAGAEIKPIVPPPAPAKPQHRLMDYRFTNELGQAVSLGEFRGQALAITFIFTRCPIPDYCPRLSRNFQEASQALPGMTNAPANWHFLSVSFDPDFDTPERLKAYAERYGYDPQHWSFLTGPRDKIAELAAQSDVTFEPESGFFNHNFRTLIIDAAGRLQTTFPIGGNLSQVIVSEMFKAAAATNASPR